MLSGFAKNMKALLPKGGKTALSTLSETFALGKDPWGKGAEFVEVPQVLLEETKGLLEG